MSTVGGSPQSVSPIEVIRAPRLALMFKAKPGSSREELGDSLSEFSAEMQKRARAQDRSLDPTVRIGLPTVDDPFAGTPWDTVRDKIDATIEITLGSGSANTGDLISLPEGAGRALEHVIVADGSTLVAGMAHIRTPHNAPPITPNSTSNLAPFAGHRDPGIDADTFSKWWTEHHTPIALRAFDGYASSYEQVHVDEDSTGEAMKLACLGGTQYTIFESNRFADATHLRAFFGQTELMEQAYQDEVGYIDHERATAFGWVEQPG